MGKGQISTKTRKMSSSTMANYSFSIYLLTNDRGADRVEPLRCILRQRDVFSSPIKSMQEHLSTPITPTKQYLETGPLDFEELKVANVSQSAGPALRDIANSDAKLRRSSMERMQEEFEEYAEKAKTLPDKTTNENKLILYGLFKEATVGPVNTSRPGTFNLRDRAKWDAWKAVEGK